MRAPQIRFPQLVQDFFLRRLVAQRGASARTVKSYRDAFELLFGFLEQRTGRSPSTLQLADLDAPLVLDFLDYLETERGNTTRTRNARLAAIHSFMRYAAIRDPASIPIAQRVLAIPAKRFDRPMLGYLTRDQIAAILAAPDRGTWSGHRDAVLLATTYNTGAQVSAITGLQVRDVPLDRNTAVHLHGKGRKTTRHPVMEEHRHRATRLAETDHHRTRRTGVPQPRRRTADPIRGPRPARPCRRSHRTALPLPARPARITAHFAAHHSHAPAAVGHRPGRHRVMARAFQPGRHPSVPRSRSCRQGSSSTPAGRPQPSHTNTIPARRSAPRLPARPLIMCSHDVGDHQAKRAPPTQLHITAN